jgi:hypothetical protein
VGRKGWEVTRSSDVVEGGRERRNTGVGMLLRSGMGRESLGGLLAFGVLRFLSFCCREVCLTGEYRVDVVFRDAGQLTALEAASPRISSQRGYLPESQISDVKNATNITTSR